MLIFLFSLYTFGSLSKISINCEGYSFNVSNFINKQISSMVFSKRRLFKVVAISKETELLNAFSNFCFIVIMHYLLYESNCSDWFVNPVISLEICYLWIRSLSEHRGQSPSAALCTWDPTPPPSSRQNPAHVHSVNY
jgi:hypothetical protein